MREVRGPLIDCTDYQHGHFTTISGNRRHDDVGYPEQARNRRSASHFRASGLRARSPLFSSSTRREAIARADQLFLEPQPFLGRHDGLLALLRQIFHSWIVTCSRRRRGLGPRVHQ
jgi:hypothetical protein